MPESVEHLRREVQQGCDRLAALAERPSQQDFFAFEERPWRDRLGLGRAVVELSLAVQERARRIARNAPRHDEDGAGQGQTQAARPDGPVVVTDAAGRHNERG